jgi:hypothetical protein
MRAAAANSRNGDRLASTWPNLRLHGPSTPLRRSAAAISAGAHNPWPLTAHFNWSMDQNIGLVPNAACANPSTVHTAVITAMPFRVSARRPGVATAIATNHMKGR